MFRVIHGQKSINAQHDPFLQRSDNAGLQNRYADRCSSGSLPLIGNSDARADWTCAVVVES